MERSKFSVKKRKEKSSSSELQNNFGSSNDPKQIMPETKLKSNFNARVQINMSNWNGHLKQAENLYLIGEKNFSYIKCDELFINIIRTFSIKWNLNVDNPEFKKDFLNRLYQISPTVMQLINRVFIIYNNFEEDNISDANIEEYISLLQKILLTIKLKKKTNDSEIKPSLEEPLSKNIVDQTKELKNKNKTPEKDKDDNNEIDETIWADLQAAIIDFEKRNEKITDF